MKTKHYSAVFLASLLGLSAVGGHAADKSKDKPVTRIDVQFHEPEKFTDIGDSATPSKAAVEADVADLRDYLVRQASRIIPEGQKLEVTFDDIDRAGGFEPWRSAQYSDLRIVKSIYPPSMKFTFRLTDINGQVLKEGRRELRDLNFQMKLTLVDHNDPLVYEKGMLDDWLQDEFHNTKPKA